MIIETTLLVAAIVSAAGATVRRHFKNARGKEIAILGPRRSGKSTLATILRSGTVTHEYIETLMTEKLSGDLRMESLSLKVTTQDPGGAKSEYGEWREIHKSARLVCYVIDAHRMLKRDDRYRDLAINGAEHVSIWGEAKPTVLVLAHIDEATGDASHPDVIFGHADVQRIQALTNAKQRIAVNLMDERDQNRVRILVAQELRS
jgi:hypothetical protein